MKLLTSSGKGRSKIVISDEAQNLIVEAYDKAVKNGIILVKDAFYLVVSKGHIHLYAEPVELYGFVYARQGTKQEVNPVASIPKSS